LYFPVLRIWEVYAGSQIRIFQSRIKGQKDPGSVSASKYLSILNPKKPVLQIRNHRILMVLGLLDPDPLVRGMDPDPDLLVRGLDPDPSIIKQK
jgi:hypothetical protein